MVEHGGNNGLHKVLVEVAVVLRWRWWKCLEVPGGASGIGGKALQDFLDHHDPTAGTSGPNPGRYFAGGGSSGHTNISWFKEQFVVVAGGGLVQHQVVVEMVH